ncbi:hypothetical protein D9M72_292340 [compost metagenome]
MDCRPHCWCSPHRASHEQLAVGQPVPARAVPRRGRDHRLPGAGAGGPAGRGIGQHRILRSLFHAAVQGEPGDRRPAGADRGCAGADAVAALSPRQVRHAADDQARRVLRRGGRAARRADLPGLAAVRLAQHRVLVRRARGNRARGRPEPGPRHHRQLARRPAGQGTPDGRAARRRLRRGHLAAAEPPARAVWRPGSRHLHRQRPRAGHGVQQLCVAGAGPAFRRAGRTGTAGRWLRGGGGRH